MKNSAIPDGYMGKVLRVDLSTGDIRSEALRRDWVRDYIGASGLGLRYLYEENKVGSDPYDPGNPLIFATGPLTGTLVPGSGTLSAVARNSLTGLLASSQSNGFFGVRLKQAGYDLLIIQGRSDKLVYLHVSDEGVSLEDASFLAGKGCHATEELLKKKYGEDGFDRQVSVASIGPAGENRVRFAAIVSDRGHIFASGGPGAIMGSKRLKAVVVHGNTPVRINPSSKAKFEELLGKWRSEALASGMGKTIGRVGSLGLFLSYHKNGWVPVKNLTTNIFPGVEKFDADYIRNSVYEAVPKACANCTYHHCHSVRILQGPYKGTVGEEVEYEILAGFGPNWGIYDPGTATMLNSVNDDLGMDAKEASFLVSMLMEGYEKGYISAERLNGISLAFGNAEGALALLRAISLREGLGDLLAEGVMRSAETLGGSFPDIAVYLKKGNAPHVHDPRSRWGTLFNQIVSDTGSQEGVDLTNKGSPDIGVDKPTSEPDAHLGRVNALTENLRQFMECLTYCYYQSPTLDTNIAMLNCVTNSSLTKEDALRIGRRVVNLLRMFNIREGMMKAHESFSPRLAMPPVDGPAQGKSIGPTFEQVLAAYYQEAGWNEDGVPSAELLRSLNLEFTCNVLER